MTTKHIRKSNAGGKHKGRGFHALPNCQKPTLCGASPTTEDVGNREGRHFIASFRPVVERGRAPAWMVDAVVTLCPACVAVAEVQIAKANEKAAKLAEAAAKQMANPFAPSRGA